MFQDNLLPRILNYHSEKKVILLTARQHPQDSPGSYAVEGFLSFFQNSGLDKLAIFDNYVIIVIPMMNIEGVVLGNTRCNAAGADLNRLWNREIKFPKVIS